MNSVSFDSMVELYDETRVFDRGRFDSAVDFLVERFPPRSFRDVFESGIGTGRIALPLAERGYRVTGVDLSKGMLVFLRKRLARSGRPPRVFCQRANATRLPFRDAVFDMGLAVHLFYFVPDWREAADELLRVVRSDGPVVLMHTGSGAEIPFLNERYKELCAELGCSTEEIGVQSTKEVMEYYTDLGCRAERIRDRWQWTSCIRLDKALAYMRARAYSFTANAREDVHSMAVERLESELQRRFDGLTTEVEVPNQVYLVVILRQS